MRHIRLFESRSEIEDDVRDIFNEYLYEDSNDIPSDAPYSGELIVPETGDYVSVIIYVHDTRTNIVNDISDFDSYIKDSVSHVEFLKKMKMLCSRLRSWGYTFDFKSSMEDNEYYIRVYEKTKKMSLQDAFGKDRMINDNVMKRVLKSEYGIDFSQSDFHRGGTSRYSSPDYCVIYLKTPIGEDHQLFKDLRSLKKQSFDRDYPMFRKVTPYHRQRVDGADTDKWISIRLDY